MKINFIANTGITRTFGNNENKNSIAKQKTEAQNNVSSPILKPLYYQRYPLASTKDMLEIEKVIQKMQEGGPYENDPILQNIKRIKEEKEFKQAQSPFLKRVEMLKKSSKATFDMEKIKSIILPSKTRVKLRSFEDSDKKYTLDRYQSEAVEAFKEGQSVIVTAPTGSGKTLIAQYGIDDTLKKGRKIIYLSPLKALSNEKFVKFSEQFGQYDAEGNFLNSDNVGIITGDVVINPDAQLLIMTTEIYRNMVNMEDEKTTALAFKDFDAVIYDEFHYLNDPDRGSVWEESVIYTPKHMKQMMLSATASNAMEIACWINSINPSINVHLTNVPEEERYVPLDEYVFGIEKDKGHTIKRLFTKYINPDKLKDTLSDRALQTTEELEALWDGKDFISILKEQPQINGRINAQDFCDTLTREKGLSREKALQIAYVLSDNDLKRTNDIRLEYSKKNPAIPQLLKILVEQNKTPALFFVFSKKRCRNKLDEVSSKLGTLLTPEESKKVLDSVNEAKEQGVYLGENFDTEYLPKLLMGYALHHAGMLPAYKSLVEKLSREGLIKACFATETMLAGINMPFKTTVFTSVEKFDGRRQVEISPTVYKQGSGRAGRRGIDDIGNVIICPGNSDDFSRFKSIISSNDTKIRSSLKLSYAGLLQKSSLNNLSDFLEKSFFTYQANDPKNTKDSKKALKNSYISYHSSSIKKIKQEAKRKLNYLREKGYVEYENERYNLTQKGEMAKSVYGINQVLFCELISNPQYTKDLTPEELAALMVIFADVKDDKPRTTFKDNMEDLAIKLSPALDLAEEITKEQNRRKIDDPIKMSTNLVPAILKFAYMPDNDEQDCLNLWKEIFEDLKSQYIIMHEGDLLRVFNSTIDLLKTINEVSDNPELARKAALAVKSLKKPPLTDILKYELNIK